MTGNLYKCVCDYTTLYENHLLEKVVGYLHCGDVCIKMDGHKYARNYYDFVYYKVFSEGRVGLVYSEDLRILG